MQPQDIHKLPLVEKLLGRVYTPSPTGLIQKPVHFNYNRC